MDKIRHRQLEFRKASDNGWIRFVAETTTAKGTKMTIPANVGRCDDITYLMLDIEFLISYNETKGILMVLVRDTNEKMLYFKSGDRPSELFVMNGWYNRFYNRYKKRGLFS